MGNHLQSLYRHTLTKYKKYRSRYQKSIQTGLYFQYSRKKQRLILERIEKLKQRLATLKMQIKIALASGALAIALQTASVQGQELGPFIGNEAANPFTSPATDFNNKKVSFADIDNDGDIDALIGSSTGELHYYENAGTATCPRFAERTGAENPFDGISATSMAAPELADLDGDGDYDLILGSLDYSIPLQYYLNNDSDDAIIGNGPTFTIVSNPGSPLDNVDGTAPDLKPAAVDIDGDGDLDIFIGQDSNFPGYDPILFYENNAGFSIQALPSGIVGFSPGEQDTAPTFMDFDGDGDFDLFVGSNDGTIRFFQNTDIDPGDPGDTTIGDDINFSEITGVGNPFNGIDVGIRSVISFEDLDGDGDKDAVIGSSSTVAPLYYENSGSGFSEITGFHNPLRGLDLSYDASPTFIDIDNDDDIDAIIGGKYENDLIYLRNDGGCYTDLTGTGTPFDGVPGGLNSSSPTFVQADTDADFDLVVGFYYDPAIRFYRNTGDVTAPTLSNENDPFGISTSPVYGSDSSPTFGDVDGDGDQDALIGFDSSGQMRFFQADDLTPSYTEISGATNPFNGLSMGIDSYRFIKPEFVDLDHDGDIDLAVGLHSGSSDPYDGTVGFFRNDAGAFTPQTSTNNPFAGIKVGNFEGDSEPTFVDFDDDGDLDLFVGNGEGKINYFENQNEPPAVTTNVGLSIEYNENDGPTNLDAGFTISDDGGDDIISAEVAITANYVNGEDVLTFTPQGGVTGSFDASTGILTLSGYAKLAVYELVLQSVTYENTSENPSPAPRAIELTAIDFDATTPTSATAMTVNVTPVNDAPVLTASGSGATYTEDDNPGVAVDAGMTISDVDNTTLNGATIAITGNFVDTEDILEFTDQNGITGSYDAASGVLTLSGSATLTQYETALQNITYRNTSQNPDVNTRTITFEVNDGSDDSNTGTATVAVISVNDAPTLSSSNSGTTVDYDVDGSSVIIDDQIAVTDVDDADLESAQITISGFESGDMLLFTDQNGITGSYDDQTGVLTLSGTSSVTHYEIALRSIAFENNTAGSGQRQIQIAVNDGDVDSNIYSRTLNVIANQPPSVSTTPQSTQTGTIVTVDLCDLISDPDNAFPELTVTVESITSGAATEITDCILTINYGAGEFSGPDQLVIQACDPSGACDQNTITIQVEEPLGPLTIYNAVSPNGDGLNDWWEIIHLTAPNKIELYNRWGDLVKTLADYAGQTPNNQLDDLPAGTYYYKIQSPQGNYEGYLVIKK